MDQEIITNEEKDFQEALTLVPEEVQDFMWGDAFEYILDVAQKIIPLNNDEREEMRRSAYSLLLRTSSMLDESSRLEKAGITPEKIIKILFTIDKEIITTAKNLVAQHEEIVEVENSEEELKIEVSPAQALASIKERLSSPSTVAPITRDHSFSKNESVVEKVVEKPKIDPYRELPSE
ncbi:MAG TPA: hypothetical protein PLQ20_00540 [Candidatus Paceibacterota bacterium]|nr:hypothetical protein [Candidatus Paceibacterota bacterium]